MYFNKSWTYKLYMLFIFNNNIYYQLLISFRHLAHKMAKATGLLSAYQILKERQLPIGVLLTGEQFKKLANIQTKESLVEALQIGVKLEQTVMLEYLYAGFSLKTYPQELSPVLGQLVDPVQGKYVG